jgi:hypothetical protein
MHTLSNITNIIPGAIAKNATIGPLAEIEPGTAQRFQCSALINRATKAICGAPTWSNIVKFHIKIHSVIIAHAPE